MQKQTQRSEGQSSTRSLPPPRVTSKGDRSKDKKQDPPIQGTTRSSFDTSQDDQQLLQTHKRRMRWFYLVAFFFWGALWIVAALVVFSLTKNVLGLSVSSGMAIPFLFPRRVTSFLFPIDDRDFQIRELELRVRLLELKVKWEEVKRGVKRSIPEKGRKAGSQLARLSRLSEEIEDSG